MEILEIPGFQVHVAFLGSTQKRSCPRKLHKSLGLQHKSLLVTSYFSWKPLQAFINP